LSRARRPEFPGAVRDDLVSINVSRRARAGLEYVNNELVVELAVGNFAGGGLYRFGDSWFEQAQLGVDASGGELDEAERLNERPAEAKAAYREVERSPLSRSAVVSFSGYRYLAHRVTFGSRRTICHAFA
jgi:hypothetical protein